MPCREIYPTLAAREQSQILDLLAYVPCAVDETLEITGKYPTSSPKFTCTLCVPHSPDVPQQPSLHPEIKRDVLNAFSRIIRLPSFSESRRPRIIAMISLRRLIRHFPDQQLWDLEKSVPGQWCLQCLHSHIRELRIAATRTLMEFLSQPSSEHETEHIIRRNRTNVFDFVKSLAEKGAPHLSETCIMTWGQLGRIASDEEGLGLALYKLTEYLSHSNMLVSALAVNEIMNLADMRGTSTRKLFEPFWKNLAFFVVRDVVTKPQITRSVAELLQMKVSDLLCLLQRYALPYLVLTKKKDVVQKIAEARGEQDASSPIKDLANLPHILALLLTQETPDIENFTMTTLRQISTHFEHIEFLDLWRSEAGQWNDAQFLTILELLKISAEADSARQSRVSCRYFCGSFHRPQDSD
jgi:serine/threonine-protein kinase ATR